MTELEVLVAVLIGWQVLAIVAVAVANAHAKEGEPRVTVPLWSGTLAVLVLIAIWIGNGQ